MNDQAYTIITFDAEGSWNLMHFCSLCGELFRPTVADQTLCSDDCRAEADYLTEWALGLWGRSDE